MITQEQLNSFGRKSKKKKKKSFFDTRKSVSYTRVSSSGQKVGYSLANQEKNCQNFAYNNDLDIVASFGGTNESAITDNREEFNKMLSYVRDPKNGIRYIIVSDYDRFSRSGFDSVVLTAELKSLGIEVVAADDGFISTGFTDDTRKGIKMLYSKEENEIRKKKCNEGSLSRVEEGYWRSGTLTKGYTKIDKHTIAHNVDAKFILEAFQLKKKGKTNKEIINIVNAKGANFSRSRLSVYLRNIFYCGLINSSLLEGEVVQGNHKPIVPLELFMEVNGILKNNPHGYVSEKLNVNRPLQADLKCKCGGVYTGYCKKEKYHYYKCNSCKHNCSASSMHNLFEELLNGYTFSSAYVKLFEKQLKLTFAHLNVDNAKIQKELKTSKSKLVTKQDIYDDNLAIGELPLLVYKKVTKKLANQINVLDREIDELDFDLSNTTDYITKSFDLLSDVGGLWSSSPLDIRREVQNLVFKSYIKYDKENNSYRTPYVNSIFSMMTEGLKQKKEGQNDDEVNLSHFVPWAGIEPALSKELDFESSASTSSATKAYIVKILQK